MSLRWLILFACAAYGGIVLFMYLKQRDLQYLPESKGLTPLAVGLDGVKDLRLKTPDGETLSAWYAEAAPARPMVLFLHGNAGEIGDRPNRFAAYRAAGFGVLFLSYRGYGGSTGSPTQDGLVTDVVAAYDWLVAQAIKPEDIVVVGESLGSGVAVQLASRRPVAALALEAPFTSAADVGASVYWWLPVRVLMKDQFDSLSLIRNINAPLLIVHGDADGIIPVAQGKRLFDAAQAPKEIVVVPGGTHVSIFDEPTWARELAFFEKLRKM
ncbi:alpha/beta hydrolase [soil metagenome]